MSIRPEISPAPLLDAFASISAARASLLPQVLGCLEAVCGPRLNINRGPETHLVRDLGLCGATILSVAELLEEEFAVRLTPLDLVELALDGATLGQLLDLVARKISP